MKPSDRMEFWRQTMAQQERSGQSIRAFCKEHGLAEHAFYAWRKRVQHHAPATFALVETGHPAAMIELALTSGERLRIPCEAAALRVVLGVLKEARG